MAENKILSTFAATALVLIEAVAAFGREEMPPNTWVAVDIDWKQPLAKVADDAQWQTGDGYSDSVLRTKTGELLTRDQSRREWLGRDRPVGNARRREHTAKDFLYCEHSDAFQNSQFIRVDVFRGRTAAG